MFPKDSMQQEMLDAMFVNWQENDDDNLPYLRPVKTPQMVVH